MMRFNHDDSQNPSEKQNRNTRKTIYKIIFQSFAHEEDSAQKQIVMHPSNGKIHGERVNKSVEDHCKRRYDTTGER